MNVKLQLTIVSTLLLTGCSFLASPKQEISSYHSAVELLEPIIFAQGQVSTVNGISFSKMGDTLYTSGTLERKFDNDRSYAGIFESFYVEDGWTEPRILDMGIDIDAYHPVLSMDNNILFFNSRSHLDSINKSVPHDIWAAYQTQQGWSEPAPVEGINSEAYDSYPSVAANLNLYFNSDRPGGKGGMDLYMARYIDGQYQKPVNLEALNSEDVENDLVIDPEERFIIFNRYIHATATIDLFIAFRKGNSWSNPRKLDNLNADDTWELTPSLSPDGKYFFYELDNNIMQVELAHLIYSEEWPGLGKR